MSGLRRLRGRENEMDDGVRHGTHDSCDVVVSGGGMTVAWDTFSKGRHEGG